MIGKDLETSLNLAVKEAQERRHEYVTVEHILYALCFQTRTKQIIEACGGAPERLRKDLADFFANQLDSITLKVGSHPKPTVGFQRVLQRAAQQIIAAGHEVIHVDSILVSLMSEEESFATYYLLRQNISRFDLINYISHGLGENDSESTTYTNDDDASASRDSSDQKPNGLEGEDSSPENQKENSKSMLSQFSADLCARARAGEIDPVIGRQDEMERIVQILCRRRKNNPLLVGEAGVGKTAIAEGLALRIVSGTIPPALAEAEIFALDMGSLLAGTRYRGDFEQRFKGLLKELTKRKKAILFIDEIHSIIGAGSVSGGAMDASNLLKPMLATGKLRCMGSTTFTEFRQHFEQDHAMTRRFQRVAIDEPSIDDTVKILKGLKNRYEDFHRVHYSHEAIKGAVELAHIHIKDRRLPDKAIDVIDEVGASFSAKSTTEQKIKHIGLRDVKSVVAKIARVPLARMTSQAKKDLEHLGEKLRAKVFGQDKAITCLESAIRMARSGLGADDQPIGNFLFSGPTGVGKTELAKQLSETMSIKFIRFDMSEYMERHAVARLIGAPPGYVGYDDGGLLTDAIHREPHCVLLLDEIEKAHPDVLNILLQIMDHGTLTDSNGRESDFRNAIIIMTTNVGATEVTRESIGFGRDLESDSKVSEAIGKAFSPEFRNRLDSIITFGALPETVMMKIVDKFVKEVADKLRQKRVYIHLNSCAKKWLAEKGYDPAYGARPMRRVVQEHLKKPLADELLFGQLVAGGEVAITASEAGLQFEFSKTTKKQATKDSTKASIKDA